MGKLLLPTPWEHISQGGGVAWNTRRRQKTFGTGLLDDEITIKELEQYLLPGEQVGVATKKHWARMMEPVITVVVSLVLLVWVNSGVFDAALQFTVYLWWVWFALVIRMVWKFLEWRTEWFCATDSRLLLTTGLITHNVAMMPLGKVTDLSYDRSATGRVLGYGKFTLESAGQDQALREINWIPAPDQTYREICDSVFGKEGFDSDDSLAPSDPTPQSIDTTSVLPRQRSSPDQCSPILVKTVGLDEKT